MFSSNVGRGAGLFPRGVFSAGHALLALFFLLFFGCAWGPAGPRGFTPPSGSERVENVPFHPQTAFQCGPASLAGVLNYYGDPASPGEIADAVFRREIRGTVSLDMVLFARERGFSATFYEGSVENIVDAVDEDEPLVVMVDSGLGPVSLCHYMVLVGYTGEGVVVNSGRSREELMPWGVFLSKWQRTKNWTLRVVPQETEHSEEAGR